MRWLGRTLWPGVPLGLLLLPTAVAWLDAVRVARGEFHAYREPIRRVVVLGFDGVDPGLLKSYLDRLPAIQALVEEGTFLPCRTTNPPESPVAWATFATGLNPGGHGIFDFVRRDLDAEDCYRPRNGMVERRPPSVGPLGFPVRPPAAINLRGGEGFWEPVARAGYRVSVLRMPLTFPARLPRGGELLCGLGVPDLRATNGSYTLFAAGRNALEGHTEFGGRNIKIYPRQGRADAQLEGPPDPRAPGSGRRLTVPVRFTFAGESAAVSLDDGPAVALEPGLFSRWVPVTFRAGLFIRVEGLVRFLLLRAGKRPRIYASPIQISPHAPPVPISAPGSFAGELVDRLGPMKTAGWPEETFASNDGVLDDVHLFQDIRDTYRVNERLLLDRLDHSGAALVTMIFTATDRMSHMFYRYRDVLHPAHDPSEIKAFQAKSGIQDPIFESYRWMDETIKATRARLAPDDVLIIVSDHGFHSWRWGLNLNTWLWEHGYLALENDAARARRRLDDLFRRGIPTGEIDWTKTRAYALGLGQIYLNLKGRERLGTVDPAERETLLEEIRDKLRPLEGPDEKRVFTEIYRADAIWKGERVRDAADLQCAFAEGYRISWQTALLGIPEDTFEANTRRWSGDHCSNDAALTAGVFLCNKKLGDDIDPGLEDIAPTVCRLFGAPPPKGAKGRALIE